VGQGYPPSGPGSDLEDFVAVVVDDMTDLALGEGSAPVE
jgi:hypothetical protein